MQSVSSRIWTRVVASISYDDNDYTTGTSFDICDEADQIDVENGEEAALIESFKEVYAGWEVSKVSAPYRIMSELLYDRLSLGRFSCYYCMCIRTCKVYRILFSP